MVNIGVKELLEAGVHFGHQTKRWNPKMKRFIFDARNGIHIIDLSKTLNGLQEACDFLAKTVGKGGKVPFPVGTDLFGNVAYRDTEIPVNPELLKEISATTGGEYYRATDRQSLSAGLQQVLDKMDRSKLLEGGATATYREYFHPFLWAAFLFALFELLLSAWVP